MNEENIKLARIQKSSKVAHIVSKIFFFLCMVATMICLITGLVLIIGRKNFDPKLIEGLSSSQKSATLSVGNVQFATIEEGDFKVAEDMKWTSDVPRLEQFFRDNDDSPSLIIGFYLLAMSLLVALLTVCFHLISGIFALILKEGNPFTDKVIKRVLVTMIILSVLLLSTQGAGFGILAGLITWVVYTILDYGRTLKIQADETL